MSGGHYDYANYRLRDIAEKIKHDINHNSKSPDYDIETEIEDYVRNYSPEVIEKMKMIRSLVSYVEKLLHSADYLYSDDTGEETFLEDIKKLEDNKENS